MGRTYADVNPPAPAHWETSTYDYSETIPHAVTSVTRGEEEDTYAYDDNGNMTCRMEDGSWFIQTYNAENRVSTVQKLASGDCETPGDLTAHWAFAYDGDGVRTATLYTPYVDGDPQTPVLTTYYFGRLYEVTGESIRKYYALAGQTVAMDDGDGLKYFLTDHLGSVLAVLDDAGAVLEQQRYLPFGAPRELQGYSSIGLTDYTYTFQRSLPDMGLMDYRARFYSSGLGRFIQPDTIVPNPSNPQVWNRYSYVYNRPLILNDPNGHVGKTNCMLCDLTFGYAPPGDSSLGAVLLDFAIATACFFTMGMCHVDPIYHTVSGPTTQQFYNTVIVVPGVIVPSSILVAEDALITNPKDPYSRPSGYRKGVRDQVWDEAVDSEGYVRDPSTEAVMDRNKPWDMGHEPGYEFRKLQEYGRENGLTRKEFLDSYNDPSHYRPELSTSNRSHILETIKENLYNSYNHGR